MKPKPSRTLARQTAELIAAELFLNDRQKIRPVRRLKLEYCDDPVPQGLGWCQAAVVSRIEEILNRKHVGKEVVVK